MGAAAACSWCGHRTSLWVDGEPVHAFCWMGLSTGQAPAPGSRAALATPTAHSPTATASAAAPVSGRTARVVVSRARAERAAPGPVAALGTPERVRLAGPSPESLGAPWRAAVVVADPSGLYLPDGTRYPLPEGTRTAGALLEVAEQLSIGHPAGVGQVVLTEAMCVHADLVAEADEGVVKALELRAQVRDRLGGLGEVFLADARAAGWEVDSLRVETRARRATEAGTRVLDLVLAPYEWLWSTVESHPAAAVEEITDPGEQAAELARLMGYLCGLLGRPWRASARQAGWDLFDATQKRRARAGQRHEGPDALGREAGRVVTLAAPLPAGAGISRVADLEPKLGWHRPLTEAEVASVGWLHSHDRRAAWLAAANSAELGYLTEAEPEMVHHQGADTVAELLGAKKSPAGIYRVRLPAWTQALLPAPHPAQRADAEVWAWVTPPTVKLLLADDDHSRPASGPGYTVGDLVGEDSQAWTLPAQGRLLAGSPAAWYETIRDGVAAARAADDTAAAACLKRLYAGWIAGTEVSMAGRPHHLQQTWRSTIVATHRAITWGRIAQAVHTGHRVVAVDNDEVLVLADTDDPHSTELQADTGRVGAFRPKTVRQVDPAMRARLGEGTSPLRVLTTPTKANADAGGEG